MAKAASRLGILVVAGGIGALAVFAIAWYDFVWVASQKRYFNERNFRVLKTLSTQIQYKIDNYDRIMSNALDSRDGKGFGPGVQFTFEQEKDASKEKLPGDDRPALRLKRDEAKQYLCLALKKAGHGGIKIEVDIREIIKPFSDLLINAKLFDAVVLARAANGRVIFQDGSSGLHFNRIDGLVDKEKQTKNEKEQKQKDESKEQANLGINLEAMRHASGLMEVNLGGTDYKLYSQPIQLSYDNSEDRPKKDNSDSTKQDGAANEYEEWILCGLVQSSHFRSDSLAISYNYILGASLIGLLLLFSLPFLKLHLMDPRERLRARDGVFLVISTFLLTGLLTFLLLDLYYYAYEFHDKANLQLKTFAEEMNRHFGEEEQRIWEQLDDFERSKGFDEALGFIRDDEPEKQLKPTVPDGEIVPDGKIKCSEPRRPSADKLAACYQPDLLSDDSRRWVQQGLGHNAKGASNPWCYPYLQNATWYGEDGWQRMKWDVRNTRTRFLNLDKANIPYYQESQRQMRWWRPEEDQKSPPRGIYPRYSTNTGENIAIFWRLQPKNRPPLIAGFISTRPVSLIQPVLPGHLEFAVIDTNGRVLFHSDSSLNMRENFLEECDLNGKLRSLIASGASDSLTANYRGRGHHLYVTRLNSPSSILENGPWTIVVFRDMDIQETMNFELITLSTYLFIIYAGSLGVLWGLIYLIWGNRYPKNCFWPNEHKGRAYRQVMVLNTALFVLFFMLIQSLQQIDILCSAFLLMILLPVPLAFCIIQEEKLPKGRWWSRWLDYIPNFFRDARQPTWRTAYLGARLSLLLLVVVLPCFTFFKIAYNFEKRLLIQRAQLNLAVRLEEHKQRLRNDYQSIRLGSTEEDILQEPVLAEPKQRSGRAYENIKLENIEKDILQESEGDRESQLWAYHQIFLKTTLHESQCDRKKLAQLPVESGLNWFFSRIRPLHNYVAGETLGLIADPDREDHETGAWEIRDPNKDHETGGLKTAWTDQLQQLVLRRHRKGEPNLDLEVRSELPLLEIPWGNPLGWLGWGVFLPVLYLLVKHGTGRVFLIDPYRPPNFKSTNLVDLFDKGIEDFPAYTLVVGPPNCGKTAQLNELKKLMSPKKLGQAVGQSFPIPVNQEALYVLDLHEKAQIEDWAATFDSRNLPSDKTVPIAIDHFECRADDPKSNEQKLLLLEKLLAMEKRKVLIISTLNPTSCFSSGGPGDARTVNRWVSVLSSFSELDFKVADVNGFAEKFKEKLSTSLAADLQQKLVESLERECTPTLRLRKIGEEFVDKLPPKVEMTSEELIDEIAIRTEAYYHTLWATCSETEKLLLVQLAQEGLVNPKNPAAIRQLMRKHLVAQGPVIRIMNESFRRFAATAVSPQTITASEREGARMSWGNVKVVSLTIALGVAAFLFITQQALFEMWMAYATGLLAAIPAVVRLFGKREE